MQTGIYGYGGEAENLEIMALILIPRQATPLRMGAWHYMQSINVDRETLVHVWLLCCTCCYVCMLQILGPMY